MSLKLFPAFAACLPIMLAACGGGGGSSSTSAIVEPPVTGLLAWNHGRMTNWHWYNNAAFPREGTDFATGFDELEESEQGDFTPTRDPLNREFSTMPGLLNHNNRLREGYASWGTPINGIGFLIATESDIDWIRANAGTWSHFDYTRAVVRGIVMHGEYSGTWHGGTFTCLEAECSSSHVRAAVWGNREIPATLQGTPGVVQHTRGDTNFHWLRRNGATASWRGAMAGSTIATGIALVGEAAVSYTVSSDSVGVELTKIKQRDDGTGAIRATYSGPNSFSWTLSGNVNDPHSDYWSWDDDDQYGLDARFYGKEAQEVVGTFIQVIPDDKIIGTFLAKR